MSGRIQFQGSLFTMGPMTDDIAYMVGHGRHPWPKFVELIRPHVKLLVDIRTNPQSRYSPHFNSRAMSQALAGEGIQYLWVKTLGGKDPKPLTEQRAALEKLWPLRPGTGFLCSESDYHACHRHYMLAPLLIERGFSILQILPSGELEQDVGPSEETLERMAPYLPKE